MKQEKKYGSKKEIAIVNSITGLRFAASFLLIPTFKILGGVSAAIFSGVFLATDWIDGHLARKFKASTFFGALFDGATDKTYGIMSLLLLMTINPILFCIPLLIEVGIISVQNKKLQNGLNVQSNMMGKIKTWFLSLSIVGSFIAVDLLNLPPFIEYMKYASLDKVSSIKNILILFGIELPAIVTQILTLKSYSKENEEGIKEQNVNLKETTNEEINDINLELENIALEKEKLQEEKSYLEKVRILGNAMFDPEYYNQNKDMPIRKLTKDLFK